jgi:hypothetical protein
MCSAITISNSLFTKKIAVSRSSHASKEWCSLETCRRRQLLAQDAASVCHRLNDFAAVVGFE